GYQVMLGQTGYDYSHQESLLDAIIGRRPDGVVITGRVKSQAARRKLQVAGIPVVEVWEMSDDPVDMMVGFSHYSVGFTVADYLWAQGKRRFALAVGDDIRGRQRASGFTQRIHELHQQNSGQTSSNTAPSIFTYDVQVPRDRKSTRLNSSHVSISYAVFCLKKKKIQ